MKRGAESTSDEETRNVRPKIESTCSQAEDREINNQNLISNGIKDVIKERFNERKREKLEKIEQCLEINRAKLEAESQTIISSVKSAFYASNKKIGKYDEIVQEMYKTVWEASQDREDLQMWDEMVENWYKMVQTWDEMVENWDKIVQKRNEDLEGTEDEDGNVITEGWRAKFAQSETPSNETLPQMQARLGTEELKQNNFGEVLDDIGKDMQNINEGLHNIKNNSNKMFGIFNEEKRKLDFLQDFPNFRGFLMLTNYDA